MEIKIEDIRIIQVTGWRNPETGKLNIVGEDQLVDEWPDRITVSELPGLELEIEESDEVEGCDDGSGNILELADYRVI